MQGWERQKGEGRCKALAGLTAERTTGEGRERDITDHLGRPEEGEGLEDDETDDLASRARLAEVAGCTVLVSRRSTARGCEKTYLGYQVCT